MTDRPPLPIALLGSINVDLVMQVDHLPNPGETVLVDRIDRYPGGKGANQAVAAARMGGRVAMIGAVGRDPDGDFMLATIAAEAIDIAGVERSTGAPTGTAHIAIDRDGENQILVLGGANRALAPAATDRIRPIAAVRLAQLETPIDTVLAFLRGGDAGTIRILNAAPFVAGAEALFAHCDLIIVNETELAAYARTPTIPETPEAVIDAARALIARPGQRIVVTRGAEGALAISDGAAIAVAARTATVVDTTGAGDCFCGVLAVALAEHRSVEESLTIAAHAAGLAVERAGAIPSLPDRAAVMAAMA